MTSYWADVAYYYQFDYSATLTDLIAVGALDDATKKVGESQWVSDETAATADFREHRHGGFCCLRGRGSLIGNSYRYC